MKSIKQHYNEYQNNGGTMTLRDFINDGRIDESEVLAYYFHHVHALKLGHCSRELHSTKIYYAYVYGTKESNIISLPKQIEILHLSFAKNFIHIKFNYSQLEKHLH